MTEVSVCFLLQKLQQIEKLKEQQKSGKQLELNQVRAVCQFNPIWTACLRSLDLRTCGALKKLAKLLCQGISLLISCNNPMFKSNRTMGAALFVCWLLNVPATCKCISGTDLLRQFYVLPH